MPNLKEIKQSAREEAKLHLIGLAPTHDEDIHSLSWGEIAGEVDHVIDVVVDEIEKLVLAKWCQHDTDTPCASCFKTQDILRETFTRFKGENHD